MCLSNGVREKVLVGSNATVRGFVCSLQSLHEHAQRMSGSAECLGKRGKEGKGGKGGREGVVEGREGDRKEAGREAGREGEQKEEEDREEDTSLC